jgi:glycosyltransferase involved in cell wall biosynthesis
LDSVVAQTFQDIECILVDDCSTDNSKEIVRQYIDNYQGQIQFKFILHEKNLGQSAARNTGVRMATGEWLYFLDSDDALIPDSLSTLLALQEKYPDVDFVQGNLLDETGKISHFGFHKIPEYCNNPATLEDLMLNKVITSVWNRLIRRSLFIDNDLFFPVGMIHEDMYWVYFLSKHIKAVAFTLIGTYIYYTTENSTMTSGSRSMRIRRYTSRIQASNGYIADLMSNSYKSHIRHKYMAVNLLSCLTELVPLRSIKHWMHFWGYILHTGYSNIHRFTLYRLLFVLILLPPACFICGDSRIRWRIQRNVINKL